MDFNFNENDLVVFDTSSLLDVYRFNIINSKRLLEYIKRYEANMWIPYQIKKEFMNNQSKAKNMKMYEKFEGTMCAEVDKLKSSCSSKILNYTKCEFSGVNEVKASIENKFDEIKTLLKEYCTTINEEKEIYKDYIRNEVDIFFKDLMQSDKIGEKLNIVQLMDIVKEGELRYRYKIAPGFKDEEKDGIDKFGDLFVWKQIISEAKLFVA